MKKTYEEITVFIAIASNWLDRNRQESKFSYALQRVMKQVLKIHTRYKEQLEDIDVEHCSVDERDNILRGQSNEYLFTKEEMNKRNHKRRKLYRSEAEIEPYYAPEIPEGLTEIERDVFTGFVLKGEETQAANV